MKTAKKQLSAQDIQDEILFKMPANKSLKLASDFSMFIMMLNKTVNEAPRSKLRDIFSARKIIPIRRFSSAQQAARYSSGKADKKNGFSKNTRKNRKNS